MQWGPFQVRGGLSINSSTVLHSTFWTRAHWHGLLMSIRPCGVICTHMLRSLACTALSWATEPEALRLLVCNVSQ